MADKATVPIYYESRIAKLELDAKELPKLDPAFDEITEGEEESHKEKLKTNQKHGPDSIKKAAEE